jgi:hypothetical protein
MAAKRSRKRTAPKQAAATEAVLAAVEINVAEVTEVQAVATKAKSSKRGRTDADNARADVQAVATKARSSKRGRTDADQENARDQSGTGVTEAAPAITKGKGASLRLESQTAQSMRYFFFHFTQNTPTCSQ